MLSLPVGLFFGCHHIHLHNHQCRDLHHHHLIIIANVDAKILLIIAIRIIVISAIITVINDHPPHHHPHPQGLLCSARLVNLTSGLYSVEI